MILNIQNQNTSISSLHFVDFYTHKDTFINNLISYISEGLAAGEPCVVIATEEHLRQLDKKLGRKRGLKKDWLITLNAEKTLDSFMVGSMPDKNLFQKNLGSRIEELSRNGKPIRAFGEMVALLWKKGNKNAVVELESLWNELAENNSLYLYCAYPELHFIMDPEPKKEIINQHKGLISQIFPALA